MNKLISTLTLAFLVVCPLVSFGEEDLEKDPAYLPIDKVLDLKTIHPAVNVNLPRLIELITMVAALWANLAYLFVTTALLRRRFAGRPISQDSDAGKAFTLGRWGLPVNVVGVVWSAFMVLNLGWPRIAVYGSDWQSRFAPLLLTVALLAVGASSYVYLRRQTA